MEFLELLSKLISINTVSENSNKDMIDFLCSVLPSYGFSEDKICVISDPSSSGREKYSLITTMGEGADALMLSGHMDTVSPGDDSNWLTDPFELVINKQKKRMFGLGVVDMKFFIASSLEAAKHFSGQKLKRPLVLVFTHDEEVGLLGAKYLKQKNLLEGIRYGIVGEPTRLLPIRLHKGFLSVEVVFHGQAGHGSNPDKGVNAIEKAHSFLTQLLFLKNQFKENFHNNYFDPPYPTLNVGMIEGGKEPNRIPDQCHIKFEMRPIPGQNIDSIKWQLEDIAASMGTVDQKPVAKVVYHSAPTSPMETDQDSAIVQITEKVTKEKSFGVPYSTEATIYNSAGLETVILGAGDIAQAHKPNEFIDMKYIELTQKILKQIIRGLCLEEVEK